MRSVHLQPCTTIPCYPCIAPARRCRRYNAKICASNLQHQEGLPQRQSQPQLSRPQQSRRDLLWSAAVGVAAFWPISASSAAELWSLADAAVKLPRGYEGTSSKLVQALREAIEVDLSEAPEREVRRKADGAKNLVKEWLLKWRDNPLVEADPSHTNIKATIEELGQFYMKNGQRARLPSSTGRGLLDRLDAAAVALPLP